MLASALQTCISSGGPADIVFGNLETPLSDLDLDRTRRSRQLRGRPEYAASLRAGGFSVLSVASNHALEHGVDAFVASARQLESVGINPCGQRGLDGWTARPVTQLVKNLRVGFLAYSMRPASPPPPPASYALAAEEEILTDVARLRAETDCLVVSLHWGEEFVPQPSEGEVAFARALVDAGVSLILGHHPHVARPVERYRNAVIAYSLGNFAADMIWYDPLRNGLMLECEITRQGVGRACVHRVRIDRFYLPAALASEVVAERQEPLRGLPREDYIREARRTVRAQRRALYRYTALNAWRFEPGALLDLAAKTLGGKLARLTRGKRDEIWE